VLSGALLYKMGIVKHEPQNTQQPTWAAAAHSPAALSLSLHGQERFTPKSSRRRSPTSVRRSRAVGLANIGAGSFVWGARMAPLENERGGRHLDLDGRRLF